LVNEKQIETIKRTTKQHKKNDEIRKHKSSYLEDGDDDDADDDDVVDDENVEDEACHPATPEAKTLNQSWMWIVGPDDGDDDLKHVERGGRMKGKSHSSTIQR
jgi:phosphopantothenoylcysteine synthetase/decarboxylase